MMSNLTYLYQALSNARATVTEIERAIEAAKTSPTERTPHLTREEFYNWIEEEENGNS